MTVFNFINRFQLAVREYIMGQLISMNSDFKCSFLKTLILLNDNLLLIYIINMKLSF